MCGLQTRVRMPYVLFHRSHYTHPWDAGAAVEYVVCPIEALVMAREREEESALRNGRFPYHRLD